MKRSNPGNKLANIYSNPELYNMFWGGTMLSSAAEADAIIDIARETRANFSPVKGLELGAGEDTTLQAMLRLHWPKLSFQSYDSAGTWDAVKVVDVMASADWGKFDLIIANNQFLSIVKPLIEDPWPANRKEYTAMFENCYAALNPGGVAVFNKSATIRSASNIDVDYPTERELPVTGPFWGNKWRLYATAVAPSTGKTVKCWAQFSVEPMRALVSQRYCFQFVSGRKGDDKYVLLEEDVTYFVPTDNWFYECAVDAGFKADKILPYHYAIEQYKDGTVGGVATDLSGYMEDFTYGDKGSTALVLLR